MSPRRNVRSGFAALVSCAALCSIACAREWYVSKAGSNADGLSWATAFNHPQDAIDAALADGGGEVWVKADTYTPTGDGDRTKSFVMKNGVDIHGGFAGTESLRSQRNWLTNVTILSGDLNGDDDPTKGLDDPLRNNSENSYHVVLGADNSRLDGFTVTAGCADGSEPGGGMYLLDASPTVANCSFVENAAPNWGGGAIGTWSSAGPTLFPVFTDCVFISNRASQGGAIQCFSNSSFTLVRCTFSGNSTTVSGGGAIANIKGTVDAENCAFTGNSAVGFGGAIVINIFSGGEHTTLVNCSFWGNTTDRYNGGAVSGGNSGLTLTNCVLWGNRGWPESQIDFPSAVVSYSCVEGGWPGEGNIGEDPIFHDPRFVDPDGPDDIPGTPDDDLRLSPGSPCIDCADGDAAPAQDTDGSNRHDDTGVPNTGKAVEVGSLAYVDLGAYEFQGDTPTDPISVLRPLAGAAWRVGSVVDIAWKADPGITNVKVELTRGAAWETIVPSAPNAGVTTWVVEDGAQPLPQTNCLLRISDASDGTTSSTSGTFAIFSGVWYVNGGIAVPGNGLTWATALVHPQDALDRANAGDEIWVRAGTYVCRVGERRVLLRMKRGVAAYGGFAGGEAARSARNPSGNVTTLDGEGVCDSVVRGEADAALDGFTVTRGNGYSGGGLLIPAYASAMLVNECMVTLNNAGDYGGGLFTSSLTSVVSNCGFVGNTAALGGGICINTYGSPTFLNCRIMGNSARRGGGVYSDFTSSADIVSCVFTGNVATEYGAGMCNSGSTSPVCVNCTFVGNSAADYGGGIYNWTATPTLTNCILWGNSAPADPEVYDGGTSITTATYSCIAQAGFAGTDGNINEDPGFVDAAGPDATYGTVDDDVRLSPGSPCIDCADGDGAPAQDIDGNDRHDDPGMVNIGKADGPGAFAYVDMGACEFQGDTPTGTVTGTVILEDGADDTQVLITGGRQTAVKNLVSGNIEYTISNVPLTATEVTVATPEVGYAEVGSPASITWVATNGTAPDVTVSFLRGTVTGSVTLEDGADAAQVTITAGGETATKIDMGGSISYTISSVPVLTTTVDVSTAEGGFVARGSPAAITWVDTTGAAAATTVTGHGTVTGTVALEDGADDTLVTISAGGQTAVKNLVSGNIEYTISNVPLVTTEVTVATAEAGYTEVGSPASITWVATDGTAPDVTVCFLRGTVTGSVTLEDGADAAQVTITAGGQTATKIDMGGSISYTISSVPVLTTTVDVSTAESGFVAVGSPAAITWVDTTGTAAATTVTGHGTVTGTVILEDGADDTLVTITAGGETAVKNLVSGDIEYTISNVPLTATGVTVTSGEGGYVVGGSPAAIAWVGTAGTAADCTLSAAPPPTASGGGGCASGSGGEGWFTLFAVVALVALRRRTA